jgi:hypothetical protein
VLGHGRPTSPLPRALESGALGMPSKATRALNFSGTALSIGASSEAEAPPPSCMCVHLSLDSCLFLLRVAGTMPFFLMSPPDWGPWCLTRHPQPYLRCWMWRTTKALELKLVLD